MRLKDRYGKGIVMPYELDGGAKLSGKIIASGVITPQNKEVDQVGKRKIFGQEWVEKVADLYNRTKAGTPTMAKELGITKSTSWRLKQKAIEQGLIKEDEPVAVIKKEQIEVVMPMDIDTLMEEFDSLVDEVEHLQDVATKHRQAALEVFKALGEELSVPVLQVLYRQLNEAKNAFVQKAV